MKKIKWIHRTAMMVYLLMILWIVYCVFDIVKLFPHSKQEMYEKIWNIKLPDSFELVYDMHTPTSFHGDGERYTIFKAQENWKAQENKKGQKDDKTRAEQEEFALKILEMLAVSEEQRPNFGKNDIWEVYTKNSNKLLVLYSSDNNYYYFFQHLQ